jgi:hypothetical protein
MLGPYRGFMNRPYGNDKLMLEKEGPCLKKSY